MCEGRSGEALRIPPSFLTLFRSLQIDKDKQRESLEKLSKPKNAKSVSAELGIKDESDLELHRAKEKVRSDKERSYELRRTAYGN